MEPSQFKKRTANEMSKSIFENIGTHESTSRATARIAQEIQKDASSNLAMLHQRANRISIDNDVEWAKKTWALLAGIEGEEVASLSQHIGYELFSATGMTRYEKAARAWERKLASAKQARLGLVCSYYNISYGTGWGLKARLTEDSRAYVRQAAFERDARKAAKKATRARLAA